MSESNAIKKFFQSLGRPADKDLSYDPAPGLVATPVKAPGAGDHYITMYAKPAVAEKYKNEQKKARSAQTATYLSAAQLLFPGVGSMIASSPRIAGGLLGLSSASNIHDAAKTGSPGMAAGQLVLTPVGGPLGSKVLQAGGRGIAGFLTRMGLGGASSAGIQEAERLGAMATDKAVGVTDADRELSLGQRGLAGATGMLAPALKAALEAAPTLQQNAIVTKLRDMLKLGKSDAAEAGQAGGRQREANLIGLVDDAAAAGTPQGKARDIIEQTQASMKRTNLELQEQKVQGRQIATARDAALEKPPVPRRRQQMAWQDTSGYYKSRISEIDDEIALMEEAMAERKLMGKLRGIPEESANITSDMKTTNKIEFDKMGLDLLRQELRDPRTSKFRRMEIYDYIPQRIKRIAQERGEFRAVQAQRQVSQKGDEARGISDTLTDQDTLQALRRERRLVQRDFATNRGRFSSTGIAPPRPDASPEELTRYQARLQDQLQKLDEIDRLGADLEKNTQFLANEKLGQQLRIMEQQDLVSSLGPELARQDKALTSLTGALNETGYEQLRKTLFAGMESPAANTRDTFENFLGLIRNQNADNPEVALQKSRKLIGAFMDELSLGEGGGDFPHLYRRLQQFAGKDVNGFVGKLIEASAPMKEVVDASGRAKFVSTLTATEIDDRAKLFTALTQELERLANPQKNKLEKVLSVGRHAGIWFLALRGSLGNVGGILATEAISSNINAGRLMRHLFNHTEDIGEALKALEKSDIPHLRAMLVRRIGEGPALDAIISTSVTGGREAIDLYRRFKDALRPDSGRAERQAETENEAVTIGEEILKGMGQ